MRLSARWEASCTPFPDRPRQGSPPGAGRETSAGLTFLGQPPVDAALAAVAVEQHAVFRLHELCALGLNSSAVRERVRAGRLHRCYHAVYSLVPPPLLSKFGRWLAAVFACGDCAVLSHRSAAALHELRPSAQRRPDVTIRGRSGRHHDGIAIHRSVTLAAMIDTLNSHRMPFVFRSQSDSLFLKRSQSTILFRPLEYFDRLRGHNLAWFGIDELTYCKEGAWQVLQQRIRDPRARHLGGFAVWTPKGFDWVYDRFISPATRLPCRKTSP